MPHYRRQIDRGVPRVKIDLAGSREAVSFRITMAAANFSRVIRRTSDVSFPGMLIKRILCGEDAILNNVDQSETLLGRLGGAAGAGEGETRVAYHHYAPLTQTTPILCCTVNLRPPSACPATPPSPFLPLPSFFLAVCEPAKLIRGFDPFRFPIVGNGKNSEEASCLIAIIFLKNLTSYPIDACGTRNATGKKLISLRAILFSSTR